MSNHDIIKKEIALLIIVLFLGVALTPGVTANEELVEITTELYGMDGIKPNIVKLTQKESIDLENLIDDIKNKLANTKTRNETVEIFNEALLSLNEYGLLPNGIDIDDTRQLIFGRYNNFEASYPFMKIQSKIQNMGDSNLFCLIAGETNHTMSYGCLARFFNNLYGNPLYFGYIFNLINKGSLLWFRIYIICMTLGMFLHYIGEISNVQRISVGHTIGLGKSGVGIESQPACGWLFTFGLKGIKSWEGNFYGKLMRFPVFTVYTGPLFPGLKWYFTGVSGFIGIKISNFFMGSALRVNLDYSLS